MSEADDVKVKVGVDVEAVEEATDPGWVPPWVREMAKKSSGSGKLRVNAGSERAVTADREVDARQAEMDLADEVAERVLAAMRVTGAPVLSPTFGELWNWWHPLYLAKMKSRKSVKGRVDKHLIPHLGKLNSKTLIAPVLEGVWLKLSRDEVHGGTLAAQTLNHLRNHGRKIIGDAIKLGQWPKEVPNPFAEIKKVRVRTRAKGMLTPHEAGDVLFFSGETYQGIFAVGLYLGMRKAEIIDLEVKDVDLVKRLIRIYSSKVDGERTVPIPDELVPYLSKAIAETKGPYVFPRKDGITRRRHDDHFETAFRRALGRAGIVNGYRHVCRRKGCEHKEEQASNDIRRCPRCGMKLMAIALPRHITFHGTRTICSTLHQESGCHPKVIQLLLGHSLEKLTTTEKIYTQFNEDSMRRELNKLSLKRKPHPPGGSGPISSEGMSADATGLVSTIDLRPPEPKATGSTPVSRALFENLPPLLTVSEVAARLRVSKPTVFRLINDGQLKVLRVGAQIRILREVFAQYLFGSGVQQ